jgi:hypothetical protein
MAQFSKSDLMEKFSTEMASNMPFIIVDNKKDHSKATERKQWHVDNLIDVGIFWESGEFILTDGRRLDASVPKYAVRVGSNEIVGEFVEFRQLQPSEGASHPRGFVLHSQAIDESVEVCRPSFVGVLVRDPQFVTEEEAAAKLPSKPTPEEMAAKRKAARYEYALAKATITALERI